MVAKARNSLANARSSRLSDDITRFLTRHGRTRRFPAGSEVVGENEPATTVFVLLDGEAEVLKAVEGSQPSVVATLGVGAIFGEMGLFHDLTRTGTVRAATELTAVEFANDDFLDAVTQLPELTFRLMRSLSTKVSSTNEILADSHRDRARWVVGYHLLAAGEGKDFRLDLRALAAQSGIPRASLRSVVDDLAEKGAITRLVHRGNGLVEVAVDRERLNRRLGAVTPEATDGGDGQRRVVRR
ncbi:MAG: cyclic nucleotide-binding domain-containing protein [Pseudomonadota bacterium]